MKATQDKVTRESETSVALRIANKVAAKLEEKGPMLHERTIAEIEDILLSALEVMTSRNKCSIACVTSSIHNNRCVTCYRQV